ncbi:RHS repeat domain-containing protein, partial [Ideonella sp.]|uniref:RHS repeat domain-containing protein n=1 Tax=Ideonella sp. TaxID=1929293 RepID=UPI0035B14768
SAPQGLQLYRWHPASGVATGPDAPPPPPPCDGGNPPPGGGGGGGGANDSDSGGGYCPFSADPVGMLSGEFSHTERDLFIDDVQPLDVTRTYRSRDTNTYGFGLGATNRYDTRIVDAPTDINPDTGASRTNVYVVLPNGRAVLFHGAINTLFQPYVNSDAMGEFRGARIEAAMADWVLYFRDGRKWTFTNLYGKLIAMEDADGNRVSVLRANDNAPIDRVVSPNGRYISFSYNDNSFISRIEDNAGRSFQYGYDGIRLQTVTDPNNKTHSYVWDTVANRITKVLDAYQVAQTTNEYDPVTGWVKKQTLADNSYFLFTPTIDQATGLATQVDITDRRGKVRRIVVGPEGFVTQSIFPLGDVDEQTTRYEYTNGQLSAVIDALSRRTEYTHDANGNVETVTRLAGTPHPVSTTTIWDPVFNKPRSYTDANKHKTTLDYYDNGKLKSVTDALNHVVAKFAYDPDTGRLKTLTNALNKAVTYSYDGADLSSVMDPLKRTYSIGHDSVGRIWSVADPLGNFTYLEWTPLNQLKSVLDPLKSTAEFVYDDNGFTTQQIDQKKNPRKFKPTAIGEVDTMTDALNSDESQLYEPGGKLRQFIDRNGQLSAVTYDGLGRAKLMSFGATAAKPTAFRSQVELTWDKGNRLRVIEDRICGTPQTNLNCSKIASKRIIKRTYNDLDQMTQEVTPQAEVNYTYDDGGRRQTMFVRNGAPGSQVDQPIVTYTWDDADRLRQIEQAAGPANGNVKQVIKLDPDDAGRRLKTTLSNGSSMNYTWDDANQLKAIVFKKADDTLIGDLTYGYDGAGRRTSIGGSMARMNLPTAEVTAQYDENNRLKQWGAAAFQYDNNGNLLSDGALTYTWDERNQLKGINNGGSEQASFQYDIGGRRTSKTIGATTTGYVYDGDNFVQELNGSNNTASIRAQLITGGLDETFLRMEGSELASLLTDANNNTVRVTDANQAKLVDYTYEPYGSTTADNSDGNTQQFTGRENDNPGNANGLYYYRARYYMPGCMRFISEDPIGWASGQTDNYAYVDGDPISLIDPEGLGSLAGCAADHYGITDLVAAAGVVAGLPLVPKPFVTPGSSPRTSIASKYLSKAFPQRIPRVWAPTFVRPFARSASLGIVAARWIPVIGTAILVYDAVSIAACTFGD